MAKRALSLFLPLCYLCESTVFLVSGRRSVRPETRSLVIWKSIPTMERYLIASGVAILVKL